jgi:integral membrane protein
MLKNSFGRYRALGFLEGGSLLVLMGIAMPVKYILGNPILVKYIGMLHGLLFLLYVIETVRHSLERKWSFSKMTIWLLIGSFVPFGTFIADYKLLRNLPETNS